MGRRAMDLPQEAFFRPQWWSSALYKDVPGKGLLLQGYTKPTLRTFSDHVASTQRTPGVWASWVWYSNEWVRVA